MTKVVFNSWIGELVNDRNKQDKSLDIKKLNLPGSIGNENMKAIVGWGGIILLDESANIVELMRAYFEYVNDESCGRCTPCRLGTRLTLKVLSRLCQGKGTEKDLVMLADLGKLVKDNSLCELGRSAPAALLHSLEYFKDEYAKLIKDSQEVTSGDNNYRKFLATPCVRGCPGKVRIPDYIGYCDEGRCGDGYEVILDRTPLVGVLGRVCVHFCEDDCRRQNVDKAISVRAVKRYLADFERDLGREHPVEKDPDKNKKIAVIGSGPAGLNAAYQLARRGYKVTIFEALPVAGGMLVVGIPSYRLPRDVLQEEVDIVKGLGVEIKLNTRVGKDVMFEELQRDYDAIFVAAGLHESTNMGVDGEDAGYSGFLHGVHYLRDMNLGKKVNLGEKVAVVGGGNVAMDCARSALRLGAKEVSLIYRRSRKEMPANKHEVEDAEAEGIKFHLLCNPTKIIAENGKVVAVECIKMELGEPDESGRRRPVPVKGSEFIIPVDTLIPAIGQKGDFSFLGEKVKHNGKIEANSLTLMTEAKGLFAGGDAVLGASTVIEAIASGNRAAEAIDRYLQDGVVEPTEIDYLQPIIDVLGKYDANEDTGIVGERKRGKEVILPVTERISNFAEVEKGLTTPVAIEEANRCLQCRRLVLVVT